MDAIELQSLFAQANSAEELESALNEILSSRESACQMVSARLREFIASPQWLAEEPRRKELRLWCLLAGMLGENQLYPLVLKLSLLPQFSENILITDWLYCELSRIYGTTVSPEDVPAMNQVILAEETPALVREQLIMAQAFRWLAVRDTDKVFLESMRCLLVHLKPAQVTFELGMALVINAVSVGGDHLRQEVEAFYNANEAIMRGQLPERNLRSFFDLGRQRIKSMLRGNFLGEYTTAKAEAARVFAPVEGDGDSDNAPRKTLPPIVRDSPKVGRNEPCPCGSGKKYKRCCGR